VQEDFSMTQTVSMILKLRRLAFAPALLLAAALVVPAQTTGQLPPLPADFAEKVSAFVQRFADDGQFSGTVLVKAADEVLVNQSFGHANAEWGTEFSDSTRFRIGSLSKHFAAAAILQLEEQGKLSLTDSIVKYYPEAPESWSSITIEQLLRHNSGIFNYTDLPRFNFRQVLSVEEVVATVHDRPLGFAPGTRYSYSNTGYVLLGLIIERISGMSWERYLSENITAKAGLLNTGYERGDRLQPLRAAGYRGDTLRLINADFIDMSLPHAAGALFSATEDFSRWLEHLESGSVISRDAFRRMTTAGLGGYGYGVGIMRAGEVNFYAHGGGIHGFATYFIRSAASRFTIVVFSNNEMVPTGAIANRILDLALGRNPSLPAVRTATPISEEDQRALAGTYLLPNGSTLSIQKEDDGLVLLDSRGVPPAPLYGGATSGVLFARALPMQVRYVTTGGAVNEIRYGLGNEELTARRKP
jgi:CubicO group peptidase (beta-lactamase class C family)